MQTRRSKKIQKIEPISNLFAQELKAAFFWASLEKAKREKLKRAKTTSPSEIIASAEDVIEFDLSKFDDRATKKNFGENFSKHLARRVADALAPDFPGILPNVSGGHESKARTARGYKKLDVNYSTPQLGLGLGVSIKTINSLDPKSRRYTKNYTRVDAELRAEAADYHERQPYAVMVALIFLPMAACDDASEKDPSSFGAAVVKFRFRGSRERASDSLMLFERVFVGLYATAESEFGAVTFFDVTKPPPWRGRPTKTMNFDHLVAEIVRAYDARNNPPFKWDSGVTENVALSEAYEEEADEDDES